MLSKVKLMAATLAMMAFAAVPAIAQDNTAIGGDAVNNTGDVNNNAQIQQDQQVNQNAQISGGQGQSNNTIDQNNEQNAAIQQSGNTGNNVAEGGDASIFDFFGFFSRLFGF